MKAAAIAVTTVSILAEMIVPALADASAGRKLAAEVCQPCHGIDGIAMIPEAPNLAGQNRSYMARQLWSFRSGDRSDQQMSPAAEGLSDDDIVNLIDWYSSIKITIGLPD
jgi:cytochrome c553